MPRALGEGKTIDKHVLFPEELWLEAEVAASKRTQRLRKKVTASDIVRAGVAREVAFESEQLQQQRRRAGDLAAASSA